MQSLAVLSSTRLDKKQNQRDKETDDLFTACIFKSTFVDMRKIK